MEFYTTHIQETQLEYKYGMDIINKQKELDNYYSKSGQIPKYTAYAYISKPNRVFWVVKDKVYFEKISDENLCPTEKVKGGSVYILDSDLNHTICQFQSENDTYKVTFNVSGNYGPTIYYCTKDNNVYPATLTTMDGEEFLIEDDDKYDIGAL
jgi:hypothetical protein